MADTTTITPEQREELLGSLKSATNSVFGSLVNYTAHTINTVDEYIEPVQDQMVDVLSKTTPMGSGIQLMEQTVGRTSAMDFIQDPLSSLARMTTDMDEQAIKFATAIGATEDELKTLDSALNETAMSLGNNTVPAQTALAAIVETKTPADLINAFEEIDPSLKPFLDVVREDPALMSAIHNAASKDITVLGGLQEMAADDLAKAEKDENGQSPFINALKDPTNRQLFTKLLNKVAEDPNLDFNDFKNVADAGIELSGDPTNKAKQNRYMDSLLNGFGLKDRRAELASKMGTPIEMLHRMWDDPHTFFDDMAEAIGGDPAQIEALKGLGEFFANFVGMYSEDPYIKAFMAEYGPKLSNNISAISGGQRETAGPIEQIIEVEPRTKPSKPTTAPNTDDLVGAGRNITVGGVTLRSDFDLARYRVAADIKPEEDTPKIPFRTPDLAETMQQQRMAFGLGN